MSRRAELMDKPLTFRTLSDLVFDFEDSYKKYLHTVKKVKIGLYVPHEPHSFQPIEWKQLVLNVSKMLRADIRKELEKYARDMRMKVSSGQAYGVWELPSHPYWLRHTQDKIPDLMGGEEGVDHSSRVLYVRRNSGRNLEQLCPLLHSAHFLVFIQFGFSPWDGTAHISVWFPPQFTQPRNFLTDMLKELSPREIFSPIKLRVRI